MRIIGIGLHSNNYLKFQVLFYSLIFKSAIPILDARVLPQYSIHFSKNSIISTIDCSKIQAISQTWSLQSSFSSHSSTSTALRSILSSLSFVYFIHSLFHFHSFYYHFLSNQQSIISASFYFPFSNKHYSILHSSSSHTLHIIKIRMVQCLLTIDSSLRIIRQKPLHSIILIISTLNKSNALLSMRGTNSLNGRAVYTFCIDAFHSGYVFNFGMFAKLGDPNFLNITSLWSLSFWPGKRGVLLYSSTRYLQYAHETSEDAAAAPHVHAGVVIAVSEQNIRRTVPESDDFAGVST